MNFYKNILLYILFTNICLASPSNNPILQKGWASLVKDNENEAFNYFWQAFENAKKEKNTQDKAESLLYLGICSYGSSLENGLRFVTQSLSEYKKLESSFPEIAKNGRSRCLQLISTIYSRQKKYSKAILLSKEVIANLEGKNDITGTLGLAYNSLGFLYEIQKKIDSSDFYYNKALVEFKKNNNVAYLPSIYLKKGNIEKRKNNTKLSFEYYNKASQIAEKTENKQAQVSCYIANGLWFLEVENNFIEAESLFKKANRLSKSLTDKTFEIKSLEALIILAKKQNKFKIISQLQFEILKIKDKYYSFERDQMAKNLELQFEVSEKDRKLELLSKEKEVSRLTNILLLSIVLFLMVFISIFYIFQKRINNRDKQLLKTREELFASLEAQKNMKEIQFQNDIEHKESQLSAITLQMLQKNELLEEIKLISRKKEPTSNEQLTRIVNSHFAKDSNWNDFDKYFESVNKNFYTKLKQKYPKISSNDLKICALIKLNLSIKEMASILNISHDSVKTARHRLRKKLELSTEDNLTEFILSV